jgi:hypothetical protein
MYSFLCFFFVVFVEVACRLKLKVQFQEFFKFKLDFTDWVAPEIAEKPPEETDEDRVDYADLEDHEKADRENHNKKDDKVFADFLFPSRRNEEHIVHFKLENTYATCLRVLCA